MSVDILITSLQSWEMMHFCCLSHLICLWSVLCYGSPRSPTTSQEQFSGGAWEADSACRDGASHPACCGLFWEAPVWRPTSKRWPAVFLWGGAAQEWGVWKRQDGTSLVVQWLGLGALTAGGVDSIPGWGTKILHAMPCGQKKKKKKKKVIQTGRTKMPRLRKMSIIVKKSVRAQTEWQRKW